MFTHDDHENTYEDGTIESRVRSGTAPVDVYIAANHCRAAAAWLGEVRGRRFLVPAERRALRAMEQR